MNWYGVKLLLHAVDESGKIRLAEESVRLLLAASLEAAEEIAQVRFKPVDLHDGFNVGGDPCQWILAEVLDVYDIDAMDTFHPAADFDQLPLSALWNGLEVYSNIISPEQAALLQQLYRDDE